MSDGPRTRWYDVLLALSAVGLIVVAGLSVEFVPPEKAKPLIDVTPGSSPLSSGLCVGCTEEWR